MRGELTKVRRMVLWAGVALSLAHELSLLFNASASATCPLEATVSPAKVETLPLGGLGRGGAGKVPSLQLGRANKGAEAGSQRPPITPIINPLKLPAKP